MSKRMEGQRTVLGVALVVSGALLVVALTLDWWGLPSAFDEPADLPPAAEFAATAYAGTDFVADAFQFFSVRDLVWLAAGIAGFGLGLIVLTVPRVPAAWVAGVGILALVAVITMSVTLISPPDFAEIEEGGRFGVDLPLEPELGGFVALGAALGVVIGVALILLSRRDQDREEGSKR